MKVMKYLICWMMVALASFLPHLGPIKDAIVNYFGSIVIFNTYYLDATFKSELMPALISIAVMLTGSFVTYCIYRGDTCNWRSSKMKDAHFVPSIFDD